VATTQKPSTVFEVYLKGANTRPEDIPLSTLSHILSAVQRLASGPDAAPQEDGEEEAVNALRLLEVKRGSTRLPIYVPSGEHAIRSLRLAGSVIEHPEKISEYDYMLNCMRELSSASRSLGCPIVVRTPGRQRELLTTIESDTFTRISRNAFIHGETTIIGTVQRVGNATGAKCGLRVEFQDKMLFCEVSNDKVARKLGRCLYEQVVVNGRATWLRVSWKIWDFEITGVSQPKQAPFDEALEALRNAGGDGWDAIDNPIKFLEEVSG